MSLKSLVYRKASLKEFLLCPEKWLGIGIVVNGISLIWSGLVSVIIIYAAENAVDIILNALALCFIQEIDNDIRVTIAAQACLLLLNQDRTPYSNLDSILIYPSTLVATREVTNDLGLVSTNQISML